MHPGVFSQVNDGGHIVGETLVQHPLIRAVGFTGSLQAGRALFDIAAARPVPIPFFGELGSTNPMFILPKAIAARGDEIATGWAGSITMGAGQFCTNPGVAIILDGPLAVQFAQNTATILNDTAPQTMLTHGIADAFQWGCDHVASKAGVTAVVASENGKRTAVPQLFSTTAANWLAQDTLQKRCSDQWPSSLWRKI